MNRGIGTRALCRLGKENAFTGKDPDTLFSPSLPLARGVLWALRGCTMLSLRIFWISNECLSGARWHPVGKLTPSMHAVMLRLENALLGNVARTGRLLSMSWWIHLSSQNLYGEGQDLHMGVAKEVEQSFSQGKTIISTGLIMGQR